MMNAECISMSSGKHQTITDTCYIVRMKLLTNQGICFRFFMGSFVCPEQSDLVVLSSLVCISVALSLFLPQASSVSGDLFNDA